VSRYDKRHGRHFQCQTRVRSDLVRDDLDGATNDRAELDGMRGLLRYGPSNCLNVGAIRRPT